MKTHVGRSSSIALGGAIGGLGGLLGSSLAGVVRSMCCCVSLQTLHFVAVAGGRATSPGAGLLWGLTCALLAWLTAQAGLLRIIGGSGAGMLVAVRDHFPALAARSCCSAAR